MGRVCYNVITFPGSNCDDDARWVATLSGAECHSVWHKDTSLKDPDVVIVPGGFSYGDYLRCGAIAQYSNIMKAVVDFASKGGLVVGICNGFQILTEAGLLPGTLMMNKGLHFICQHQYIVVENAVTPFTSGYTQGEVVDFPIAHKEGNFYIDEAGLQALISNKQVVFRYCDSQGNISAESNPNGSLYSIAGIVNERGNVLGLMPHPERACDEVLPSQSGKVFFTSINNWINEHL